MTNKVRRIRVLLADDHPLVRSGIRATLAYEKHIDVVGEATHAAEVPALCAQLRPELLILDLSMPGPSPLETLAAVRALIPELRVLILSAYDDEAYVRSVMNVGVDGYLLKDEATEALVRAVTAISQGGTWFSRVVIQKFVDARYEPSVAFTPRELALISGIAQGWDNRKMALEYDLAEQTVRNYISRLYDKVGVRSRSEAVVWARTHGYAGE